MFSHGLDYGLMSILSVELMFLPMSERNLTSGPATGTPVAYVFFLWPVRSLVMHRGTEVPMFLSSYLVLFIPLSSYLVEIYLVIYTQPQKFCKRVQKQVPS